MAELPAQAAPESPGVLTVADRLRTARRRRFVGRAAELALLRDALAVPEPPFNVLSLFGPGGVAKTTLLAAFADEAADLGREPLLLDLRGSEPSPAAAAAEIVRACGLPPTTSARDALARRRRRVLLLDTFEAAVGLEEWLREAFLPALPAGALTVVASRARPGEAWLRDAGWRDLLCVVSLRNLAPDEARTMLERGGVADAHRERLIALTHGHPLALSLLVDEVSQEGGEPPQEVAGVPDVVRTLVASFLAGLPTPRHRRALEIAARARFTTAGLLRSAFGEEQGEALFAWLRGLSFMEVGPQGLFPHDLAREVIDADLRWRDAAAFAHVHALVRRDVVERLTSTGGLEQQHALADLMFLHRGNPAAALFWGWESLGEVYADELRQGDEGAILAMVERHEGPDSASIAGHWLERQPRAFTVFRGRAPEPLGFLAQARLAVPALGSDRPPPGPTGRLRGPKPLTARHAQPRATPPLPPAGITANRG